MKLRIGHLSTLYHTAILLQSQRALEKKGLEPDWKLFGGGPAIINAMIEGQVDIGYIGLPPTMIGIAKGAPVKCIAGGHINGTVLCTREKIRSSNQKNVIKSLEGKNIGSPPKGSIHDIIIRHLLRKHRTQGQVINYPWADFIPLEMDKNQIQAAIGTPALAVYMAQTLDTYTALLPANTWPNNPSYGIIGRDTILDNSSLIKTFLEEHEKACNQIIEDPAKAANQIALAIGQITPEFALKVLKLSPHYCSSITREYVDSTLSFNKPMKEMGYIPRTLKEKDIFHQDLIRELHPGDDHYKAKLKGA